MRQPRYGVHCEQIKLAGIKTLALVGSGIGLPIRIILRRLCSERVNGLWSCPVYFVKTEIDIREGFELIEASLTVLEEKSPLWSRRVATLFKSIMVSDTVETATYFSADRCCYLNPWGAKERYARSVSSVPVLVAGFLVRSAGIAMLLDRRFGYLGARLRDFLVFKSTIRFLRKCLTEENHLDILGAIGLYSELADEIRPGRRHHEVFMQRDVERWRVE